MAYPQARLSDRRGGREGVIASNKDDRRAGFDSLMAQMGVKPLPGRKPAPARARPAVAPAKPAPQPATPPPPEAPPRPPAPVVELAAPAAPAPAPSPAPAPTPEPAPALLLPDPEAVPTAGLLASLHAQGLRGPTELDAFLRAVADARLSAELLRLLGPLDPALLERFLSARLVLLGDCPSCPQPPAQAVVRVPSSRCSVCQGLDLKAVRRRLVDACLVGGFTRLALVGGRGVDQRFIRDLLGDARIELLLLPAGTLPGEAAWADLRRASVVVEILGAGPLPDLQVAELACPRVQVESTAPGPLVEAIAAALRAVTG